MSKQSSRGSAWRKLRLEVLQRDGWTCAACGAWLEEDHVDPAHRASVDHIVAKANGGRDEPSNLQAMDVRCNGIKSDKAAPVRYDWFNPRWLPDGIAA